MPSSTISNAWSRRRASTASSCSEYRKAALSRSNTRIRHPEKVAGLVIVGGYVRGWRARGNAAEIARREAISVLMRQGWGQDDPLFRQMFTSLFIPGANRVQMDWFNELQRRTLTPENALAAELCLCRRRHIALA